MHLVLSKVRFIYITHFVEGCSLAFISYEYFCKYCIQNFFYIFVFRFGVRYSIIWNRLAQKNLTVPHHSVFTGQMPFLPPNQQSQSTEGLTATFVVNDENAAGDDITMHCK